MPTTSNRSRIIAAVAVTAFAACLLPLASAAGAAKVTRATPAQVAAFWAKVFKGPKPHGVPPLNGERTNPRTVEGVKLWDVRFDSYRDPDTNKPARLAGVLGMPNEPGRKFPGLVVTHSVGAPYPAPDNVEEMATFFAQRGYVTLAFYMRGWGTSRMAKLNTDSPLGRMDGFCTANLVDDGQEPFDTVWAGFPVDMYQAGEFLATQPEVSDPNSLAVIGHSGGGYAALMAGVFNKRFKVIASSSPAATAPDLAAWMAYWKNSPWSRWAATQPDPALAIARAVRAWSYTGAYQALNNPNLVAKDRAWKLKDAAVWFYAGDNDPAVPVRDVEAAWRLADGSNQKVLHISPSGGHGGPESWVPAQAWLAGHYQGRKHAKPKAELKIVTQRDGAVILSGEGSSDALGLVAWEYDLGDGTKRNSGPTIGHTYQRPGNYTARLTVTNGAGLRETASVRVSVQSASVPSAPETARSGASHKVAAASHSVPVRIVAGEGRGTPGGAASVPILMSGPEDGSIQSFTITVEFDNKMLVQPRVARGPAVPGPAWWSFTARPSKPGVYLVAAEQFVPSPSPVLNGVIGHLVFNVPLAAAPGVYEVKITKAEVNGGSMTAETQSGSVRIEGEDR